MVDGSGMESCVTHDGSGMESCVTHDISGMMSGGMWAALVAEGLSSAGCRVLRYPRSSPHAAHVRRLRLTRQDGLDPLHGPSPGIPPFPPSESPTIDFLPRPLPCGPPDIRPASWRSCGTQVVDNRLITPTSHFPARIRHCFTS